MWRRMVSVFLLVHITLPQPITEDENARHPRQLDFGECCPCLDNTEPSFRKHWLSNGRNPESAGQLSSGFSRAGSFDDCPCRFRGADSEGSSSIFFPSALRHTGAHSKPADSKEDPKNLLEPEVGLASSVLETLREATDEEYKDALARDAARARATDDAIPEESAQNIVAIILPSAGDEEDFTRISESHIQESRCIHPLGSSLSRMRTAVTKAPSVLTELLRVPKIKPMGLLHRDSLDIDNGLGASNVQERVVDVNRRNKKIKENSLLQKNSMSDVCAVNLKDFSSSPISSFGRENETPQQNNIFKSTNTLKMAIMRQNENHEEECDHSTDMKSAASDMTELFSDKLNSALKLGPLTPENSPLNLKNLLKLRDVELIPPGQLIEKLKLAQPALQLPPLIENMPKLSDLLKNGIKLDFNKNEKWSNAKNYDKSLEENKSNTNIQVIPRDKAITTAILDALPSTSNINEVKDNCDIVQRTEKNQSKLVLETKTMNTDIIESIPNSFHSTEDNDHNVSSNDLGQEAKRGDEDTECDLEKDKALDKMDESQSQSDISIRNLDSRENVQPIESYATDQDLGASNCLEAIHGEPESSNNSDEILDEGDNVSNSNIKPLNLNIEKPSSEDVQQKNSIKNDSNIKKVLNNNKESTLRQSLKSVRESILRKIEDRKKSTKLIKQANGDHLRDSNTDGLDKLDIDCEKEANENFRTVSSIPLDTDSKTVKISKSSNKMQLEDLQTLSDALLKKSLMKPAPCLQVTERDKPLGEGEDQTINLETASSDQRAMDLKNPSSFDVVHHNDETSDPINIKDGKDEKSVSCVAEDFLKPLRIGPDVNEMTVEASEPVISQWHDPLQLFKDTTLGSPLFQNIVVQPSSLFESLGNSPTLDLRGALNLPTLDDIRERLANVLNINGMDSTVEDIDCPNENPIMSAEPSISNYISRSPVLPLEDLHLDIFQLKPSIIGKSRTSSTIPALNLKSFKTKVPVPKNLDMKPLKLQSTVGNDGGLLGASLTLGSDTMSASKLFESLGNPLQNLPSLDEAMTRMRTNVESLVSNPLDLSSRDSIPRISDLTSNLRTDTENTIRALQERMGSSLMQANNLLSSSPKKPQELIERIADAKEDLDAKLKGLHYDLNDRLTSIHDNILDQTGLSSLNPLFQGGSLSSRNNFNNNDQNTGMKRLNTPASKRLKLEGKKEALGKTANYKNRPFEERKASSIASQRKFKMPASASVPVPKTIEVPKLKSTLSGSGNDLKMRLGTIRQPSELGDKLRTLSKESKPFQEKSFSKQASTLKEKKVKVTFGSTTPTPISTLRSQHRSNSKLDGVPTEDLRRRDSGLARRFGLKSRSEPIESPSEVQPTRMRSPMTTESRGCNDDTNSMKDTADHVPFENENRKDSMRETLKKHNSKITEITHITNPSPESRITSKSSSSSLPSWPKADDNSFLAKVRDAVKARLSNFDPKTLGGREPKTCSDMERSASENTDVILGENLKENVHYKCRMVCTKS